ncbi:Golgi apparatus protein 1-like [Acanthaster planci]|uniref:Golgi apparatus protein 1-like n=1 Tax=Acanthaster planci TaxID=133434 RepID=A0A8B7XQK6_ACAPL|nr:Golgi apparatus protein 1-like [Acanthaster planci]
MASGLRVFLVTCVTLCIFPAIHGEFNPQDGTNIRQNNDPANVGGDRYPVKRDVGAGGGQRPLGGAAAMPAQRGFGPQQPQQQFQPNPKLAIAPNPNNPGGQGLGMLKQPGMPGDDIARGNFGQGARFDQGQRQPGQPGQLPGQQRAWVGRGDVAPKPYPAPGQGRPDTGRPSNRPMRINDSPQCREDVAHFCGKNARGNNFSVLDCLQNAGEKSTQAGGKDVGELSDTCNRFLWSYKMNLTKDVRFDSAAFEVCKPELKRFPDCDRIERGQGLLLPCLYDVAENITTIQCRQYINRMKAITFSDYRLIQGFYDQCRSDIESKNCGNVKNIQQDAPHRQGATINCLEKGVEKLQPECKKQILRVAELSANDYHTDRALYFACRDDRERFCEGEAAGQGAIYNCLLKHKFKEDMSENCRNKLTTRQKVASVDAKANYRLFRKCKNDIKKTKCNRPKDSQNREFRLSKLLICLEEAKHNTFTSYHANAEVAMATHFYHRWLPWYSGYSWMICVTICLSLQDLVKTADAGANYRIDKALHKACKPVRDKLCKDVEAGDAKILSCLMENIYSSEMTKECETELLLLQYFVARDFKLDPLLFKNCQRDVAEKCYIESADNSELPQGVVVACLHRYLHPENDFDKLTPGCQAQVHRVLRQRAVSVHLNPQIEANCREDLGKYCNEKTGKGEELSCLQEHLKELTQDCHSKIGDFTQEEAEDIKMNRKLMAACAPMIKQLCKDFLSKKVDEGAALQCLIDHKNDDSMNEKCQAGIEHFQLIQLQDYRFNFKFKESCRQDVIKYCKNAKDKSSIISCLSTKVRDAILMGHQHNISENCRKQLKAELLQRSEDIKLDPELFKGCEGDVQKHCNNLKAGKARILECLRDHRSDLSEACHVKLFNRVKEQAQLVKTDFAFMHACKKMITQFCTGTPPESLFKCLKSHKNEPTFDSNCKTVLTKRSIQRKEDFRLNPRMQKACRRDMPKFCSDVLDKSKKEEYKEKELEGEMLLCLKKKFPTKTLSPDCENYIRDAIQEASMDIRMDPVLFRMCKDTAKRLCSEELETPGQGLVEECLKTNLHKGKITDLKCRMQVIRLLQEGRADVHIDTLLYKACALDIKHFCAGIPQGEGRQMSCLLEALEDSTIKLHADCQRMLSERKEMWSYAVRESPPNSLQDLAAAINASEARGYFLTVLLVIIGVLFFGGLCCGRATKRVRAELKNK